MASRSIVTIVAIALVLCSTTSAYGVPVSVDYADGPAVGFFDPSLGESRRRAFEFAVTYWANTLQGAVPIVVVASMESFGGTGSSALLASTQPTTLHRGFSGSTPGTWYGAALANQLAGVDLNGPDIPEISMVFNADIDDASVLGSIGWYYATDGRPGVDIDMVTVTLHELAHGLNFFDTVDPATGGFLAGDPGIFDRFLFRPGVGSFASMTDSERLAALDSEEVHWGGAAVAQFDGRPGLLYAPNPFRAGASLSHWDVSYSPDELLEPFYAGVMHDPGLALAALMDMGWQLAAATPTPRAPSATPTTTASPAPTAPTYVAPKVTQERVFVSNFDDGTVSIIDRPAGAPVSLRAGNGPLGLAADPTGRNVFVANFQDGSVSRIDARTARVEATRAVGLSAYGIAVTPDERTIVVTDTEAEQAVIVDAATLSILGRIEAGMQAASIVLDPSGSLGFVTNFSGESITVIDVGARLRRALIRVPQSGIGYIAMSPATGIGAVSAYYSGSLTLFDSAALAAGDPSTLLFPAHPEGVVFSNDGSSIFVASHSDAGDGTVTMAPVDNLTNTTSIPMGSALFPQGIALAPNGQTLYVANAGDNSVSQIDVKSRRVVGSIPVGQSPMGVISISVPFDCVADCNEDGQVLIDELLVAVSMSLGSGTAQCPAADPNNDTHVAINELIQGVQNALRGCNAGD